MIRNEHGWQQVRKFSVIIILPKVPQLCPVSCRTVSDQCSLLIMWTSKRQSAANHCFSWRRRWIYWGGVRRCLCLAVSPHSLSWGTFLMMMLPSFVYYRCVATGSVSEQKKSSVQEHDIQSLIFPRTKSIHSNIDSNIRSRWPSSFVNVVSRLSLYLLFSLLSSHTHRLSCCL